MRVLIADDSQVIADRLKDLLKTVPDIEVVAEAKDALDAIRSIRENNPDAVILDLQMPGGSGLDVIRAIRPRQKAVYILVCTNFAYSKYREECLNAGADSFLDKSSDFEKIPGLLRAAMKKVPRASSR